MMNDKKRLPVFVGVSCITVADIRALEEELLEFERKYGIRSETFYAGYISGEEPEHDKWSLGFGEWASVYQTWFTFTEMLSEN